MEWVVAVLDVVEVIAAVWDVVGWIVEGLEVVEAEGVIVVDSEEAEVVIVEAEVVIVVEKTEG